MTQPTHTDLQRDFGRMEGRMDAFDKALAEGFSRIENALTKIDGRLDAIDTRESERKGAWRVIVAVAGAVGGLAGLVVPIIIGFFTGR